MSWGNMMEEATITTFLLIFGIDHSTDKRLLNEQLIKLATILKSIKQVISMYLPNERFTAVEDS
jgi:hypothetical protein